MWVKLCFILFLSATEIVGLKLTILHTNDVHARFEQINKYGSQCSHSDAEEGKCFGGVARRFTKIQEIRGNQDNVLLLDAGDQFMGTLMFNVHQGMATSYFMNRLKYDAMCVGNHEFDLGLNPLEAFLGNVTFGVLSANIDITNEPKLQNKLAKSTILTVNGERIGVIGYTTQATVEISNPGPNLVFTDIIIAVTQQVTVLQNSGVNKIIALGHAGIKMDRMVAAIDGVDLVVGGHSNTFLYNGDQPSNEDIEGTYPLVIDQPGDGTGLVVQDYTWGKYLGYLNLTFDEAGTVTEFAGNPILLDKDTAEDAEILQDLVDWLVKVDELSSQAVGHSNVLLDGRRELCRVKECNIGNLQTDAILHYHLKFSHPSTQWAPAAIVLLNAGAIRKSIDKGPITVGEIMEAFPYLDEIDLITVKGRDLREQLEHSVSSWTPGDPWGGFLQMSGIRVVYDISKPVGQRVLTVEVRCLECDVPSYGPLDDNVDYKLFASKFLLNGGDGYTFSPSVRQSFNTLSSEALIQYIKSHKNVYNGIEGRIGFHTDGVSKSSTMCGHPLLIVIVVFFIVSM